MIEDEEMDTSDWAVPPETEKMLRERIVVLENALDEIVPALKSIDWKHEGMSYAPEGAAVIRRVLTYIAKVKP